MSTPTPKLPLLTRAIRASIAFTIDAIGILAAVLRGFDLAITGPAESVASRARPPAKPPFWIDNPTEAAIASGIEDVLVQLGWPRDAIQWDLDDRNDIMTILVEVPLARSGAIKNMSRRVHQSMPHFDTPTSIADTRDMLLHLLLADVEELHNEPAPTVGHGVVTQVANAVTVPTWTEKQAVLVEEIRAAAIATGWTSSTSSWTWIVEDNGNGNYTVHASEANGEKASARGSSLDGALRTLRAFLGGTAT